ncbi:MAG: HIT domain-containing protein [Nitriliruptorales bacterium]|nr:HIT domain-containing protein [Nitriliruptorales bacterium]
MAGCIFCAIVEGSAPAEVVDADEHTVAFMDINPATAGHALVVPRRHIADLWDMTVDLAGPLMTAVHRLAGRMRDRLTPEGLNLLQSTRAAAFQTVFHLHVHLIPRYSGDTIRLPWTPSPGDPAQINAVAERLRG